MRDLLCGLCFALGLLKLAGVSLAADVSWWIVFLPIWAPFGIIALIIGAGAICMALYGIVYAFCWLVDKYSSKK